MRFFEILKGDKVLWIAIILLSFISVPVVFSSTGMLAYKFQHGNTFYYLFRHTAFLLVGLGSMYFFSHISYKYLFKLALPLHLFSMLLLLLTLFLGTKTNDASRWLNIPIINVEFQTSDLAKFTLLIYVAKTLSTCQSSKELLKKGFFKSAVVIGSTCLLILPANFSTAFLLAGVSVVLLIIGRVEFKFIAMLFGAAILILLIAVGFMKLTGSGRVDTWERRIESFMGNGDEMSDFQSNQAKIAIARGGLIGKGPGNSIQRNVLPHPYSDFVFAIIIEEYGFVMAAVIVALYLCCLFRAGSIARKLNRTFPALLCVGLTLNIVLQAFANMLVAVSITPVTGQVLPFVSMGGTSMIFTSVAMGIVINISRYADKKEKETEIDNKEDFDEVVDYPFIAG